MAHQDEGWPLGLMPLTARVGLERSRQFSGSISFTTLLTPSTTSSTHRFSDLDTLYSTSTGSFFRDKSITLGSLIGISSMIEISRRSVRGRAVESSSRDHEKRNQKMKPWLFSLCSRLSTDAVRADSAQSLGHYLEAERRAAIWK